MGTTSNKVSPVPARSNEGKPKHVLLKNKSETILFLASIISNVEIKTLNFIKSNQMKIKVQDDATLGILSTLLLEIDNSRRYLFEFLTDVSESEQRFLERSWPNRIDDLQVSASNDDLIEEIIEDPLDFVTGYLHWRLSSEVLKMTDPGIYQHAAKM